MRITKGLFLAAVLGFGGVLAGAAPELAAAVPECDGRGSICYTTEKEECTKLVPCGYSPPLKLTLCCAQKETVTESWYLIEPD